MVPINCIKVDVLVVIYAADGLKEVVKDAVKLRSDFPGAMVENQGNRRGMFFRKSEKASLTAARMKFWNLLSILKSRIKNVSWTTPNMNSTKGRMRGNFLARELFFGRKSVRTRKMVSNPECMVHCHRPQRQIVGVIPVKG